MGEKRATTESLNCDWGQWEEAESKMNAGQKANTYINSIIKNKHKNQILITKLRSINGR